MKTFEKNTAILDGRQTDVDLYHESAVAMVRSLPAFRTGGLATIRALQEASRRFGELHAHAPSVPHYADWLAEIDEELSIRLREVGQIEDAEEFLTGAKLRRTNPLLAEWPSGESLCRTYERGEDCYRRGLLMDRGSEEAMELFFESLGCFQKLVGFAPGVDQYVAWLAACEATIASCFSANGQRVQAIEWRDRAIQAREQLVRNGWQRPLLMKCKLANTLLLQCEDLEAIGESRARLVSVYTRCCALYHEVLSQGCGLEYLDRYVQAAAKLSLLNRRWPWRGDRPNELATALELAASHKASLAAEFRAVEVLNCKAAKRKTLQGLQALRIGQLFCVWLILIVLGILDARLFILGCCPAAIYLGTAVQLRDKRHARVAFALEAMLLPIGIVVGQLHDCLGAAVLLPPVAFALATVLYHLQSRWMFAYKFVAIFARVSRQTDDVAEEWAYWISQNAPTSVRALLLVANEKQSRPRLRLPFVWFAGCFAVSCELALLGIALVDAVAGYVIVTPPSVKSRRRHCQNACTTWAVLLRRPLHLARGDDVPLGALCA
jgi:hypothetical protein